MTQSCKTCAWCVATTISDILPDHPVVVRHCHRYAPRLGARDDDRWPKVDFSEWCGEYVERCEYDRAI